MERRRVFGGIIDRKERWGLTWRGWFLAAGLVLALVIIVVFTAYPFLAPTERVPAQVLVIEGWSPPSTLEQAAAEFKSGKYDYAVLIRPVLDVADEYESGAYYAHWISRLLVSEGIPNEKLAKLFPNVAHKDRTYHSALAVKEWIQAQHLTVDALNVATAGPHARRSRLLYEKAFGRAMKIGIIALQSPQYDPRRWWRTSEGFRDVIGEFIAYVYARLFFIPSSVDGVEPVQPSSIPAKQAMSNAARLVPHWKSMTNHFRGGVAKC